MSDQEPATPTFGRWMGSMWLYTVLRVALFLVIFGLFELAGLHGLLAAVIALLLSMPLSFILLARPRAVVANNIEQRINARRHARDELSSRLDPDPEPED